MADIFIAEYRASLEDLTFNSKPLINTLTMLADENKEYAAQICIVLEERLRKVQQNKKLPVLYLLDSIVKNLGGVYVTRFQENLVNTFVCVFQQADEKMRKDLYKLRVTWKTVFPVDTLRRVDNAARRLDPNWPVLIEDPKIHVNPAFLKQVGEGPVISQLRQQEQLKRSQESAAGVSDTDRNRILERKRAERSRLQQGQYDHAAQFTDQHLMQRFADQEQVQKDQVEMRGTMSVNDAQTAIRHQPAPTAVQNTHHSQAMDGHSSKGLATSTAVEIKEADALHLSTSSAKLVCSEDGVGGIVHDPRRVSRYKQLPDLALPKFLQELHAEAVRKRPILADHIDGPPAKRGLTATPVSLTMHGPAANMQMQPPPFMPIEPGPMAAAPAYPPPVYLGQPPAAPPGMGFLPNAAENFPGMNTGLMHGPYPHVAGAPPLSIPPGGPLDLHGPVPPGAALDLHGLGPPGAPLDRHGPVQPTSMHGPVGDMHSIPMNQRNHGNRPGTRRRRKVLDQLMRDFDEIINYSDDELLRKFQYVIHRSDKIMSAQILKPANAGLLHNKLRHLEMLLQQQHPESKNNDNAPSRIPDVPSLQATHPRLYERMKRPPSPRRRRGGYGRGRGVDVSREGSPGFPEHSNDTQLQSSGEQNSQGTSTSTGNGGGQTDLQQLLLRLTQHGMLPTTLQAKKSASEDLPQAFHPNSVEMPTISLEDSEQLTRVYPAAVEMLYIGKQCSSCGWRFTDERAAKYGEHLDWHYQLNTLNKTGGGRSRNWMLPAEDWLSFVEGERLEDRVRSHIFDLEKEEVVIEEKKISCPKLNGEDNMCCAVCGEELKVIWHPEEDEWHYEDAVRIDGEVYHYICSQDGDSGSEQGEGTSPASS